MLMVVFVSGSCREGLHCLEGHAVGCFLDVRRRHHHQNSGIAHDP